ncbi:hypothetical protein ACED51_10605 [Photobacterium swingsii]|uniref:Uncharacterized protein n=2 Tax=Vibrio TaxID=662 RepID=A0A0H3ZQD2_9VIBR|nr:hypothetical protein [Vibrio tasmaniensis]AKN40853.1 hypothetical protein [Vibrio sp. 1F_189]
MASQFYPAEALLDDPVQQVAREAYCIVMNYPHQGPLDDRHVIAIRSVELNIVSEPIGLFFDEVFKAKLLTVLPDSG